MDDQNSKMARLESKIDKLDNRLDGIDVHMAVYNEQLKSHIEGVNLARAEIKRIDADLAPIKSHVSMVTGALKLVGLMATVASVVAVIIEILKFLK